MIQKFEIMFSIFTLKILLEANFKSYRTLTLLMVHLECFLLSFLTSFRVPYLFSAVVELDWDKRNLIVFLRLIIYRRNLYSVLQALPYPDPDVSRKHAILNLLPPANCNNYAKISGFVGFLFFYSNGERSQSV